MPFKDTLTPAEAADPVMGLVAGARRAAFGAALGAALLDAAPTVAKERAAQLPLHPYLCSRVVGRPSRNVDGQRRRAERKLRLLNFTIRGSVGKFCFQRPSAQPVMHITCIYAYIYTDS